MFAALTARLRSEIKTIRNIAALYDHIGGLLYNNTEPDPWAAIRSSIPNRPEFHIYNHCAALTRLYAVYAAFVDELVQEYLRTLPELYETYTELPIPVVKQHRLGLSQILPKLGESGSYSHLQEVDLVAALSRGLSGERPYALLPDAFFVDRQNYRLEAVVRMFGCLGLDKATNRITNHPRVKMCIDDRFGGSATLSAELKRFVDLRNEAAHTHVDNVIGMEDLLSIAELVDVLCVALAEILSCEVMQRRYTLGQLEVIGEVLHLYGSGMIPIVKMKRCRIAVGEEIIILRGSGVQGLGTICSIQDYGRTLDTIETSEDQELGIRLDRTCKMANSIARMAMGIAHNEQLELVSSGDIAAAQVVLETGDADDLGETAPGEAEPD